MRLQSSCENRKTEVEADLLGLRLLLGAGIDPHVALRCWGESGPFESYSRKMLESMTQQELDDVEVSWSDKYTGSHPVHKVRLETVRQELERWKNLARKDVVVVKTN